MGNASAKRAHEAILALKPDEAKAILSTAMRSDPSNPNLLCEQAILDCYFQREFAAANAYARTAGAENREQLRTMLRNHFFCCTLQNPLDARAGKYYAKFSEPNEPTPAHVGIEISAILIVKNEEQRLEACLKSLDGIVSQIVVVDTGSTDRTVEIARNFGATIGHFDWCNDYAAARNKSLKLATGQWALWIDADEELEAVAGPAIKRAVIRPQYGGYYVEIVNFTDDREQSNEFLHNAIRLFRNVPGMRFSEPIHEQVKPAIVDLGMLWATIDGPFLRHHGYRPSEMTSKGKIQKTIEILETVVANEPENSFQLFNLANAYFVGHCHEAAASVAERCAATLDSDRDYGSLTYQIWAAALSEQGEITKCLQVCDQADSAGYGGILNEFERAKALAKSSRIYEAIIVSDRCVAAPWPKGKTGDRGIFTHKRYVQRGQILSDLGRLDEAQQMFGIALAADPESPSAIYSRAYTYERSGDTALATDWFRRGLKYPDTKEFCELGINRCAHASENVPTDSATLRLQWETHPEDEQAWEDWYKSITTHTEAMIAFEQLASRGDLSPAKLVRWGDTLGAAGKIDLALEKYSSAIRLDSSCTLAYLNAGDLLYKHNNFLDAANMYENALRYAPDHAEAWFTLGNCLAQLGLNDGAITCYEQTLVRVPGHVGAYHNLGVLAPNRSQKAA